jgi:hypothetical protein
MVLDAGPPYTNQALIDSAVTTPSGRLAAEGVPGRTAGSLTPCWTTKSGPRSFCNTAKSCESATGSI